MILKLESSKKTQPVVADCYTVQECDATGDAMKNEAGIKIILIYRRIKITA